MAYFLIHFSKGAIGRKSFFSSLNQRFKYTLFTRNQAWRIRIFTRNQTLRVRVFTRNQDKDMVLGMKNQLFLIVYAT